MVVSPFDASGGTSVTSLKHTLLPLQRRYGLWLCYLLYFLLSLILPVNVDRLVTLALLFTLVFTHLHMGVHAAMSDAHARVLRRHLYSIAVVKAFFLVTKYVFFFEGLRVWFAAHVWQEVQGELSLGELALPLDSSQTMQLQLLDVVVLLLLSVFQRRALTFRDDGGVEAASDDDSVVGSGATGGGGVGGGVGGGSTTKGPTARAPMIGDHYVALPDGKGKGGGAGGGKAPSPSAGTASVVGPQGVAGAVGAMGAVDPGAAAGAAPGLVSSLASLYHAWLCMWYLGSCYILVGMVIMVGVVRASVFGAVFFLGGAFYILRCVRRVALPAPGRCLAEPHTSTHAHPSTRTPLHTRTHTCLGALGWCTPLHSHLQSGACARRSRSLCVRHCPFQRIVLPSLLVPSHPPLPCYPHTHVYHRLARRSSWTLLRDGLKRCVCV
jgi:hypothetical protein